MQIKGLHKGVYKLYGYVRKEEVIKAHTQNISLVLINGKP